MKYQANVPDELPAVKTATGHLPFGYESTGDETWFTCRFDPAPTARRVFWFHRPETLADMVEDHIDGRGGSLRARVHDIDPLPAVTPWLRDAQHTAIRKLEQSLQENRPRALIQMATGSGKTFAAANIAERLITQGGAQRILFLVDRANLGKQTLKEFQGFDVPGTGRKFSELYNIQRLGSNHVDPVAKVCVSTIQRVYSILRGDDLLDEELDEYSTFDHEPERTIEVDYNEHLPIESFDVIIVDECHRSIYGVWRQVLEYFDAFLIGLTATPGKQTYGFFNQNLVMEYGFPQAVADGVNVDFDVFRLSTAITESGSTIEGGQGYVTTFRNRETRQERLEAVDEDLTYDARGSRPAGGREGSDPHCRARASRQPAGDVSRPSGRRARPPRQHPQDLDLRQGRLSRRRHRPHRARGVRQGQRRDREDHLQVLRRQQARGPAAGVPHRVQPAHRGHRRHDRDGHRREADRGGPVHADGAVAQLLRADEGPRCAHHRRCHPPRSSLPTRRRRTGSC